MIPSSSLIKDTNEVSGTPNVDENELPSSTPSLGYMGSGTVTATLSSLECSNGLPFSPILPNSPLQRSVRFKTNTDSHSVASQDGFHFFSPDGSEVTDDSVSETNQSSTTNIDSKLVKSAANIPNVDAEHIERIKMVDDIDCDTNYTVNSSTKRPTQSDLGPFVLSNNSDSEPDFDSDGPTQHIGDYIVQPVHGVHIQFDTMAVTSSNGTICAISSNGLSSGRHEWSIVIKRCSHYRQEIGIISESDIQHIDVSDRGVVYTAGLGARAVYGNELGSDSTYYCSYNRDNKQRCYKDLTAVRVIGWTEHDILTVNMDIDKGRVKFLINGEKVRKTLSIQKENTYYPFIAFAGDCLYEVLL